MKVSGFSFIKNAVKNDYPIKAAIESILPICDDFYIAVGLPDDGTMALINNIDSPKITLFNTNWDETLRVGGSVFAVETNKAMDAIPEDSDWCFYIQGDECVHEKFLPQIKAAMEKYLNDPAVEGLLFNYLHFYGSYQYVGSSRGWYRNEIRVIRNNKQIRSYRDAQGFRINDRKLQVKQIDATIYHYGWAQSSKGLANKVHNFSTFYAGEKLIAEKPADSFNYANSARMVKFSGEHPAVIKSRMSESTASFDPEQFKGSANQGLRHRLLQKLEDLTGYRLGEYKNYKII